jgi:hypothetical protein
MTQEFFENIDGYKVLTPDGFKPFTGISLMKYDKIWRLTLENGQWLECSHNHKIFINGETYKELKDITLSDEIFTLSGFKKILSIEDTGNIEPLYDLIEVGDGHRYYTNGILSSNCQFITFEETLINPIKLSQLDAIHPIRKTGQTRWFTEIEPSATYVVSLDPSMGTGGDNSAIQVIELPSLRQVAEWCNNKTPIEEQVRTLKRILHELQDSGNPEIYWSVESNTLGEAALVVIRDTGEENFPGTMLHDPKNRLQGRSGRRAGFVTTNKSKLEACAKLKFLIESGKMKINSKGLLSELKVFVSRGNTFEARVGQTDDLIMAMVLAIRMTDYISTWDDKSQAAINSNVSDDDSNFSSPMPICI